MLALGAKLIMDLNMTQLELFNSLLKELPIKLQEYLSYRFNGTSLEDRFQAKHLKSQLIELLNSIQD